MNTNECDSTPRQRTGLLSTREYPVTTGSLIRAVVVFAAAVLTLPLLHATAHAAPSTSVHYRLTSTATALNLSITDGVIAREGSDIVIKNPLGQTLFRLGLHYRDEYLEFPIDANVTPKSVSLIPSRDISRAHPIDPVQVNAMRAIAAKQTEQKQTKQQRDDEALARFNGELSAGMTISSLVGLGLGALIGAVVGCGFGAALGAGIGCIFPGIEIGATLGSIVGVILGGGGTLIYSAINYFQTINSPV